MGSQMGSEKNGVNGSTVWPAECGLRVGQCGYWGRVSSTHYRTLPIAVFDRQAVSVLVLCPQVTTAIELLIFSLTLLHFYLLNYLYFRI